MTTQNHFFSSEQLSVLCDIFEPCLNFDTPVVSAVFKLKQDTYTDEKWDRAIDILHPVLPLKSVEQDGETVYVPVYEDAETLDKSVSIYVAFGEYKRKQNRPSSLSDLYYYGSPSNKQAQMQELNKFFNVVRFSQDADAPFWYALEVAVPATEERGRKLLSQYITPVRMYIADPILIENYKSSLYYTVQSHFYYDFGSAVDYAFFRKIAVDLEEYQKQRIEYDHPNDLWEPKRLLSHGMQAVNDDFKHTR